MRKDDSLCIRYVTESMTGGLFSYIWKMCSMQMWKYPQRKNKEMIGGKRE